MAHTPERFRELADLVGLDPNATPGRRGWLDDPVYYQANQLAHALDAGSGTKLRKAIDPAESVELSDASWHALEVLAARYARQTQDGRLHPDPSTLAWRLSDNSTAAHVFEAPAGHFRSELADALQRARAAYQRENIWWNLHVYVEPSHEWIMCGRTDAGIGRRRVRSATLAPSEVEQLFDEVRTIYLHGWKLAAMAGNADMSEVESLADWVAETDAPDTDVGHLRLVEDDES